MNALAIDLDSLWSRQLILVSGKGGTGKTSLAVFLAQMAARQGKQVLLCHLNRLAEDTWEGPYLAQYPKLSQMEVTANQAFKEYILLKLKSETLYHLFVESSTAMDILRRASPALNELLLIGKIYWECRQRSFWFLPKWDHVIVDLPATGHALTILNIPRVVKAIFQRGIIAYETGKIEQLLRDTERTCLVPVALPEFMVVQETLEFIQTATTELGVALGPLILNKLPSAPFSTTAQALYPNYASQLSQGTQTLIEFFQNRWEAAHQQEQWLRQRFAGPLYSIPLIEGGLTHPEFYHIWETRLQDYWLQARKGGHEAG